MAADGEHRYAAEKRILRVIIKERAFDNRASDRLLHMDEINQANLEGYLSARGRRRRKFLRQVASWAL